MAMNSMKTEAMSMGTNCSRRMQKRMTFWRTEMIIIEAFKIRRVNVFLNTENRGYRRD